MPIIAYAPGRVTLMGDHTDYAGGLVLPLAVDRGTTVTGERGGDRVVLTSDAVAGTAEVPLDVTDPSAAEPPWARYVAGVVAELRPTAGLRGTVTTTLPVGAGLSSSAALELSVALALGAGGNAQELALLCQRAEQAASGVPCGVMDQLASAAGVRGHALLIDCTTLAVTPVAVPHDVEVVVIDSGRPRALATSAYAERRRSVERAADVLGPLRQVSPDDVAGLADPVVRRRARHVVSENRRVEAMAAALAAGDLTAAGRLMAESHRSLAEDHQVSTPELDALVAELTATPGVYGARLTGAGFGGCVVALVRPGAEIGGWPVQASAGAGLLPSR